MDHFIPITGSDKNYQPDCCCEKHAGVNRCPDCPHHGARSKDAFVRGYCCDWGPCALHIQLARVHENGGHQDQAHKDCKLCAV